MVRQLGLLIFALGASGTALAQNAPCTPAFDTDASVWDSAVMGDGTTLFPIGGSGQVNGAFTACATPGVQVALRASERFVVSPGHEEDGIFHMPTGQSGHPLSPFYRAGHEAWETGEPTPFLPGETVHTLRLVPGS